jgi:hypothetical protein
LLRRLRLLPVNLVADDDKLKNVEKPTRRRKCVGDHLVCPGFFAKRLAGGVDALMSLKMIEGRLGAVRH